MSARRVRRTPLRWLYRPSPVRAAVATLALLGAAPAALLATAPPALAGSSAYQSVLRAYQTAGSVPACRFSARELQSALKGIDTYGAQYFADFATAVQTALSQRASGTCSRSRPAAAGAALSRLRAGPGASSPRLRSPVAPATSAGIPLPLLLLAIIAGLGLLGGTTAAAWRRRGWRPRWALAWSHAWGEAGHRAGAVWLDFLDWARAADR